MEPNHKRAGKQWSLPSDVKCLPSLAEGHLLEAET